MRPKRVILTPLLAAFARIPIPMACLGVFVLVVLNGCAPKPPSHGMAFLIGIETNGVPNVSSHSNLTERIALTIRLRVEDALGLRAFVEMGGPDRLTVKMRELNADELKTVRELLTRRGLLEFCMVHPKNDDYAKEGLIPPGYRILKEERSPRFGTDEVVVPWLVSIAPERGLTGRFLRTAVATRSAMTDEAEIDFEFNEEGAKLFEEITTEFSPSGSQFYHLAVVLDGVLTSAPRINSRIAGGRGRITGNFNPREAYMLATLLGNPLESNCRILDEKAF